MIDLPEAELKKLTEGCVWFDADETSNILLGLLFEDDFLEFDLNHNTTSQSQSLEGSCNIWFRLCYSKMNRHLFFDFERSLKAMFKKHGYTS